MGFWNSTVEQCTSGRTPAPATRECTERERGIFRVRADARARERGEVSADHERSADIACERADVRPGSADDAEVERRPFVPEDLNGSDLDYSWCEGHVLPAPYASVRRFPSYFHRTEYRRDLLDTSDELAKDTLDIIARHAERAVAISIIVRRDCLGRFATPQ